MPKLVRLYIICVLTGFGISALFLGFLLWQDVMGLRGLIFGSDQGMVAALMLFVFNGALFAGVQFAITVMAMAEDDHGPRGGRKTPVGLPRRLVPIKIAQGASPKR